MKQTDKNKISTEKIINAAIRDFNENNSNDICINNICRKNNMSKGLLYHYFKSKDDLLYACVFYATQKIAENINSFEINPNGTLTENLHNYYEERIKYWCMNPDEYTITRHAINHYYSCNDTKILESKKHYNDANDNKLLDILSKYEIDLGISAEKLLSIIQMIYENMFMHSMDKIIAAVKINDTELAAKRSEELLTLYDNLIHLLLYGIINKEDK